MTWSVGNIRFITPNFETFETLVPSWGGGVIHGKPQGYYGYLWFSLCISCPWPHCFRMVSFPQIIKFHTFGNWLCLDLIMKLPFLKIHSLHSMYFLLTIYTKMLKEYFNMWKKEENINCYWLFVQLDHISQNNNWMWRCVAMETLLQGKIDALSSFERLWDRLVTNRMLLKWGDKR